MELWRLAGGPGDVEAEGMGWRSTGGLQACRRGGTDVWSAGVGSSSHTGRVVAGIWHRQLPGLSGSPSSGGLEAVLFNAY